jgi:hypothetical protein
MKFAKFAATLVCIWMAGLPLVAKDKKKDHDHGKKGHSHSEKEHNKGDSKHAFSTRERECIQAYVNDYSEKGKSKNEHKGLPPGLAKKVARGGQLPPGWEKKVSVGETMPAEVYKECFPLPKELAIKLPTPPAGIINVTVDGKIVRLMEASKQILDVFEIPAPFLSKR